MTRLDPGRALPLDPDRLVEALDVAGPTTVLDVASALRARPGTVWRHLRALERDGRVRRAGAVRGRGRPAALWAVAYPSEVPDDVLDGAWQSVSYRSAGSGWWMITVDGEDDGPMWATETGAEASCREVAARVACERVGIDSGAIQAAAGRLVRVLDDIDQRRGAIRPWRDVTREAIRHAVLGTRPDGVSEFDPYDVPF